FLLNLLFFLCVCVCVCLLLSVISVPCWSSYWRGGFAWDWPVVLYSNAAVVYRVPFTWKLVHAGLMLVALLLAILGLCAVLGLAAFLLPCSAQWFHNAMKPVHIWLGKAILILSLTSSISGINDKLLLALYGSTGAPYSSLPEEAKFVNSLGVFIVAFGMVAFGILSKKEWKWPETHQSASVSVE
uniref:Lysosomal membrane ascorbate-dependent ferrireductase CYB561A3 n=1 Tax=Acanthochromis polyacanthus TaxID=80966 RepID=A0A3Q1FTL8_9TELE